MKNTKISWATHTFNPWIGCTKVSAGCERCYAEATDNRWGNDRWGKGKQRGLTSEANWKKPLQWDREAAAAGIREKVFCASMADVFDAEVPDEWRFKLFDLVYNTPHLDWLILTKRPEIMRDFFLGQSGTGYDPIHRQNVWLGTTAENQEMADKRIPILMEIPGVIHWLSIEPQIGPVNLEPLLKDWSVYDSKLSRIDWVISGGESGAGARVFDLQWARDLRDQCYKTNTAFFMKQLGCNWVNSGLAGPRVNEKPTIHGKWDDPQFWPSDLQIQEFPRVTV